MHIKLKKRVAGAHVEVQVFMGVDENHYQYVGVLTMDVGQWQLFGAAMLLGADATRGHLVVETEGPSVEELDKAIEEIRVTPMKFADLLKLPAFTEPEPEDGDGDEDDLPF